MLLRDRLFTVLSEELEVLFKVFVTAAGELIVAMLVEEGEGTKLGLVIGSDVAVELIEVIIRAGND